MPAPGSLLAMALAAAPAPAQAPRDSYTEARRLYESGDWLAAARVAVVGYMDLDEPAASRIRSARLVQEAYAMAYEATAAAAPRPTYLCRALDVLDATAPLAVDAEDRRRHETLINTHRTLLTTRHPGFVCEVGTELRPVLALPRVRSTRKAETPPTPVSRPDGDAATRKIGAASALKVAGASTLALATASFAVMFGGLAEQALAHEAGRRIEATRDNPNSLTLDERDEAIRQLARFDRGRSMAIAGGIAGAALTTIGAALLVGSRAAARRTRVHASVTPESAGLILEGRF